MKRPTLHVCVSTTRILPGHLEQRIPDVSYSRFAELIGLRGIFVDDPQMPGSAGDQALASETPESILPGKQ
jgi:hypothetical protein